MPSSSTPSRRPHRLAVTVLAVLLTLPHTALPATAEPTTTPDVCADAPRTEFVDAAAIAEAQREAVQCLAAYGITRGVDDQPAFAPAAAVTREQMATFLTRTAMQARHGDLAIPDDATSTFLDVAADSVHAPAINWLADREVATGTGAQTFTPRGLVTRQQLASFFARLLRELGAYDDLELDAVLEDAAGERFSDLDQAAAVHRPGIEVLQALGVVGGFADGTFRPDEPVTRQQLAGFVVGAAQLLAEMGSFEGSFVDVEDS